MNHIPLSALRPPAYLRGYYRPIARRKSRQPLRFAKSDTFLSAETTGSRASLPPLSESPPGYAYVESVEIMSDETRLTLRYANRDISRVVVSAVPEPTDVASLASIRHVLAVQVRVAGGIECVAVRSVKARERRLSISLGVAMALAAAGVHTVVTSERPRLSARAAEAAVGEPRRQA